MRFDGKSGRTPAAEARRYVYAVLASVIDTDMDDPDGWLRGGIENEFDVRRLKAAAKKVQAELVKKASR